MNGGAHVLVVSRDPMLLQTRQLILGAFFQVNGAGRMQEVESLFARGRLDLVVLCYTLSQDDRNFIINLAEGQKPQPRILSVRSAGTPTEYFEPDQELMVEAGPYGLLKKCAEMLGVELKAKPQTTHAQTTTAARTSTTAA